MALTIKMINKKATNVGYIKRTKCFCYGIQTRSWQEFRIFEQLTKMKQKKINMISPIEWSNGNLVRRTFNIGLSLLSTVSMIPELPK